MELSELQVGDVVEVPFGGTYVGAIVECIHQATQDREAYVQADANGITWLGAPAKVRRAQVRQ